MTSTKRTGRNTVTMRDVAKLANVSQSTVSRVLSGTSEPIPIGEETRRRASTVPEGGRRIIDGKAFGNIANSPVQMLGNGIIVTGHDRHKHKQDTDK